MSRLLELLARQILRTRSAGAELFKLQRILHGTRQLPRCCVLNTNYETHVFQSWENTQQPWQYQLENTLPMKTVKQSSHMTTPLLVNRLHGYRPAAPPPLKARQLWNSFPMTNTTPRPRREHVPRFLKASRRGQDKRCRHTSAAIPPNELSWEDIGNRWQHMATCGNIWQHERT